jgi:hypothetical protein
MSLPSQAIANPVSSGMVLEHRLTPPPPTRTIGQRTVYTAVQADLRSMISSIQTQEQLDALREKLDEVQ